MGFCAPDAVALMPAITGCSDVRWAEAVADVLPRPAPVVYINVGANKGYNVAEHMGLWSQRPVTAQRWHEEILAYAQSNKRGFLKTYSCGNCNACKAPRPAAHARSGGQMHLLELTAANRALLRHLVRVAGLHDAVTVHDLAASNETGHITMRKTMAGDERASLFHGRHQCDGCTERVEVVRLDDFVARQGIGPIYTVSIDTEGSDARVIEGMAGVLARKQVALLEFEVQRVGFRGGRTLRSTVTRLFDMGYSCFWQFPTTLVPASGACWRDRFGAKLVWSNMLCAHEPAVVAKLENISISGYEARQSRHRVPRVAWRE